jgi:Cns1/TTC4 Wheel domain
MKKAPEPGDELHPMLEGLQQLKYDPEENTAEELADKYKEDGNYWMKAKKYRISIMTYTEGLEQKHENQELIANLYNNRSAAHFFLQNYRSSFDDARLALKHKPDYHKVKMRILKCLLELKKFEDACKEVEKFLIEDPTSKELIDFQKLAIIKKTEKMRNERKSQMEEKKRRQEFQTLVQVLIQRKVKFEEIQSNELSSQLTLEIIRPKIEPLENHPVKLDKQGTVHWPAVFCYPEFQISDIQQQINEMETIRECLEDMFTADDEQSHNYKNPDDMNVYFENRIAKTYHIVDQTKPLKDIISDKNFWVFNGYLTFYVIPKKSKAESEFLNKV